MIPNCRRQAARGDGSAGSACCRLGPNKDPSASTALNYHGFSWIVCFVCSNLVVSIDPHFSHSVEKEKYRGLVLIQVTGEKHEHGELSWICMVFVTDIYGEVGDQ